MSVEATGWAFRQKIPPKPKMVLMALADQTDEATGRVCYGKTDMGRLAEKASVPERSLYRYINALMRNGYLIRESGKEAGRSNNYWLCLDRALAESLKDWQWAIDPSDAARLAGSDDENDDPQDMVDGSATTADPATVENLAEGLPPNGRGGLPYVADQESSEEPKNISAVPLGRQVSGFSRRAQDAERENATIHKQAKAANALIFVIEGSRAWDAWIEHRRRSGQIPSFPTCTGCGEHAGKRGWYMPSLFPPQSTGPPQGLSDQDAHDFAN